MKILIKPNLAITFIVLMFIFYFSIRIFIDLPPTIDAKFVHPKTTRSKDFSKEEVDKMWKAHKESNFLDKACFNKYLRARDKALYKNCIEEGYGNSAGGGCYHYLGSYNSSDAFNALEYCKIEWGNKSDGHSSGDGD